MMGDCIVHLDHHEMVGVCWAAIIDRVLDADLDELSQDERVDRYKAEYERALLAVVSHG